MNSNSNYSARYYNRLQKYRRKYFFEKFDELSWRKPSSFIKLFQWLKEDFIFLAKWSLNIVLQIRRYGPTIRREYGRSYWSQWKGFMYVRFILRIYPVYYKTRLLFKEENWQLVDDFVFNHHLLQLELVQSTTPDEYKTIKNKFKFYQYCISKKIQTPEVLAVIENGEFTYQKVDDFIPHTTLFVKNLSGGKGKNTAKFDFENGGYIDNQKNKYSRLSLKKKLESVSIKKGPVLIQPVLSNHGSWRPFTSGGLATCRIVTARSRDDEKIIPMFGCFRMPVGDSVADNYSLGGIIAPVDLSTGKVGVGVSSKPINGKFEFIHHPDTQHQFEGEILPYWTDLLEFTLDVHKYFKTIFVGWDVSLTTNGCTMIEGNIGWASGSYEIPFQDPLKNTIYPELFEKWMEKYQ